MTKRYDALEGLRVSLVAINGSAPWTVDLSKPGQVSIGTTAIEVRMAQVAAGPGKRDTVQIRDGVEEHRALFTSPRQPSEAGLELIVEYVGLMAPTQLGPQRVSQIVGDIILAVGNNPGLGGSVHRAGVARVEEPAYDPGGRVVGVTVRIATIYNYVAGTTI